MLTACRYLLYLYPEAYRKEFGAEMLAVLCDRQAEGRAKGFTQKWMIFSRELGGLFWGALQEQARAVDGFPSLQMLLPNWRLNMKPEFRFPKATAVLMPVILAAVVMTIEKAKAIQAAASNATPPVMPIPIERYTLLPAIGWLLVLGCAAGAVGWGILFAFRRSGMHRLSGLEVKR
jgi:hypothetical protein